MRISRRFMVRGAFHELRGMTRQFVGKISSNKVLRVKGTFERLAGNVEWKLGKIQGIFGF